MRVLCVYVRLAAAAVDTAPASPKLMKRIDRVRGLRRFCTGMILTF